MNNDIIKILTEGLVDIIDWEKINEETFNRLIEDLTTDITEVSFKQNSTIPFLLIGKSVEGISRVIAAGKKVLIVDDFLEKIEQLEQPIVNREIPIRLIEKIAIREDFERLHFPKHSKSKKKGKRGDFGNRKKYF